MSWGAFDMKRYIADVVLIAAGLLWIVGVDYFPVMKWIGLPLNLGAFAIWAKFSPNFEPFCKWIEKNFDL